MKYELFFRLVMGGEFVPYPYQKRLATEPWPEVLHAPAGFGKTAAVVLAWLFRRLREAPDAPTRLVYCLPAGGLLGQTEECCVRWLERVQPLFEERGHPVPTVHRLQGGRSDESWDQQPESPAILVGTQEHLLSRALHRGYGMSRYRWPVHFGLLNNDVFWVFDEIRAMGVGVETSAQLQGLRNQLGTLGQARTLWMSALPGDDPIDTVDFPAPAEGRTVMSLGEVDHEHASLQRRLQASKQCHRLSSLSLCKNTEKTYPALLAQEVLRHHKPGELTLVILNCVKRAQAVFQKLQAAGRTEQNTFLLHSCFRRCDVERHEAGLREVGDRIVVSTQAIEAGLDISARVVFSELAPWPSLVQRWGRCNRAGEFEESQFFWIDLQIGKEGQSASKFLNRYAIPYSKDELVRSRAMLEELEGQGLGSLSLRHSQSAVLVRPVVRRRDLLDLFDTTLDLCGCDVSPSRFVQGEREAHVQVFWRDLRRGRPSAQLSAPRSDELCEVPLGQLQRFAHNLQQRDSLHLRAWTWNSFEGEWQQCTRLRPGQVVLLPEEAGGYCASLGWVGSSSTAKVPEVLDLSGREYPQESIEDEPDASAACWLLLAEHLHRVTESVEKIVETVLIQPSFKEALIEAARWHDVGKAHPVFQDMLTSPVEDDSALSAALWGELWATSHHGKMHRLRRFFRHELASALAWLSYAEEANPEMDPNVRDLIAYLIASHHGRVRFSIRALPGEQEPSSPHSLFAYGVWEGDELPRVTLPDGRVVGPFSLDLSPARLGPGSWLERTSKLLHHAEFGPFRLCFLETLLRVGSWRAIAEVDPSQVLVVRDSQASKGFDSLSNNGPPRESPMSRFRR